MLALERKATLMKDTNTVYVRSQPYGGAVQLRNLDALRDLIGDFQFDSEQSRSVQDFRILIQHTDWPLVRQFCLQHLQNVDDSILECDPSRELVEEFAEGLQINLEPHQHRDQWKGFVVENEPTPTDNIYSRGFPTVRIYSIFEVKIVDQALGLAMLTIGERFSDAELHVLTLKDAQDTGRGRANTVLNLPINQVRDFYLGISSEKRYAPALVNGHLLDISVLAVLEAIEVPQFQRL